MSIGWLEQKRNEEKQKETKVVDKDTQAVQLPQSRRQFDDLYNTVVGAYSLEDTDLTKYDFCEALGSLGSTTAEINLGYLGYYLKRRVTHKVTYEVVQELRAKFQALEVAKQQADTKTEGTVNVINIKD